MSRLQKVLKQAVTRDASDVHLKAGHAPFMRIHGGLSETGLEEISAQRMAEIIEDILPARLVESFAAEHEADFSFQEPEVGRFRANLYLAQGSPVLALRHVKSKIPDFEELRLPTRLRDLARAERGVVLVSGTTSSGKSTTLAAVLGEMNRTRKCRVITVEDPIEYTFSDIQAVITQREVGLDTVSYTNALKHLMRQDPDVIFIGEMRDRISVRTGLMAAETGHLVLSTLHASNSALAVPRILDVFPSEDQDQIRLALAGNLHTIVCQRLVPATGGGVVPAVEILINTPTVRKLLEKNQLELLSSAIETGREDGMQSFNQAIYDLIKKGLITEAEGMRFATNPEALKMNLQGIFLDEGNRILST